MKKNLFPANERGEADHGWLQARHSFSFANYYDPEKMGFGVLRVLNDDAIDAGKGFGTHPHENMEIITIPLEGSLLHEDSMGHESRIRPGEVQVMSAGTGIRHSEFASPEKTVRLFQIWVLPGKENVEPRYDQKVFSEEGRRGQWQLLVSPHPGEGKSLWIHQDAYISRADLKAGEVLDYERQKESNGIFVMNISGRFSIEDQILEARDALGLEGHDRITLEAKDDSEVILLEVPV